jgi:GH25 family lysozyme M1 (1,4-beta-N-acetylmuramidase)
MIKGIDTSSWNHPEGAGINFAQVKASGIDIAIQRASEGLGLVVRGFLNNSVDYYYPYDAPAALAAGLTTGAYHGLDPLSDIAAQADLFLTTVGDGIGIRALDVEPVVQQQVSAATARSQIAQFRDIVSSKLNRPTALYCDEARAQWLGITPEWLASYGSPPPAASAFWQTGDTGSVPGIVGAVDTDQWLGSAADLLRFTGAQVTTPPNDPSNAEVVAIISSPTGQGYGIFASDGGVFTFGDFIFYGSAGAIKLNKPIVDAAHTPSGKGYWLCASDGGIFTYGDAKFCGSTGNLALVKPITRMAPTPSGDGYWLIALDGGVFSFGDAAYFGRVTYA